MTLGGRADQAEGGVPKRALWQPPAPSVTQSTIRRRLERPEGAPPLVEQHIRIGEVGIATRPGEVLTAIGLGSCVGVCVVDHRTGIVALAHVFLPTASGRDPATVAPGKFADVAIPRLLDLLGGYGPASRTRLSAVMIGGAKMFELGMDPARESLMDVGTRNIEAVHEQLELHGIRLAASAIGGARGRTMRAYAGSGGMITCQEVASNEESIWPQAMRQAA